jgi:mono/diheme cytochrome c family protein
MNCQLSIRKNKLFYNIILYLIVFLLSACGSRDDSDPAPFVLEEDIPNQFLTFLNTQAYFAIGEYQLFVLPSIAQAGEYSGSVLVNDQQQTIAGTWSEDADNLWQSSDHTPSTITFNEAGGLSLQITCSTDCGAYMVKNNYLFYKILSTDNSINVQLEDNQISSVHYANTYYQTVDPNNTRTTLANWKTTNGFDSGFDEHVIFRDSKDLGYGRDMYAKFHEDGRVSLFVNNFVVPIGKGNPANYGPLNLVAAIDQNFDYQLGSNAIEFSAIENEAGVEAITDEDFILKFFTFAGPDENGQQKRITSADLDGRGIKHMPTMCQVCHGARLMPLNLDGSFNVMSLKSAKFNQLELASFEFMDSGEFSKAHLQAGIRAINQAVQGSYEVMAQRDVNQLGYWDASFANVIAQGRYGGEDFVSETFIEDDIPEGWQQTDFRPEGVETLYREVVEPHCISCHSIRGFNAGNDEDLDDSFINGQLVNTGTAINFSNYEKFIGYSDLIIDYVYKRGVMPLSLRNYETFWAIPSGAPSLLASFLPGFDVINAQGEVQQPGVAVAKPGRDRIVKAPVILNGSGSYFAKTFNWQIISGPPDHDASLENSSSAVANLVLNVGDDKDESDSDGEYIIQLSVGNSKTNIEDEDQKQSQTIGITLDSTLAKHGSELNFSNDIRPILQTTLFNQRTCQSCHFDESNVEGIPVYYDNSNSQLYWDVRGRVDFRDPDNSILIRKPTRLQHGGGVRIDLNDDFGKKIYSTLMEWILHGAPCGAEVSVCAEQ